MVTTPDDYPHPSPPLPPYSCFPRQPVLAYIGQHSDIVANEFCPLFINTVC